MDSHLKDYVEQCESQLHQMALISTKTDFSILDNQFKKSQLWHLFWNHIDRVYFSPQQHSKDMVERICSHNSPHRPSSEQQPSSYSFYSSMRKSIRRMNVPRNRHVDKQLRKEKRRHKAAKQIIHCSFEHIKQEKYESAQQESFKYYVRKQMLNVIRQKERQLFTLSITRIVQEPFGNVSLHLDPSFRVTQLDRGMEGVKSMMDVSTYKGLCQVRQDDGWCHFCRNHIPQSSMARCQYRNKVGHNSQLNIASNPLKYLFKFYKKDTDESARYFYPYLQYRVDSSLEYCQRMFCNSCLNKLGHTKIKPNQVFFCPFCTGNCNCQRCVLADQIAKHQAEYFRNDGQIQQLTSESIIYSNLKCEVSEERQVERVIKKKRGRPCKSIRTKLMYEYSETKDNSNVVGLVQNDDKSLATDMAVETAQ